METGIPLMDSVGDHTFVTSNDMHVISTAPDTRGLRGYLLSLRICD